jgi:fatty acid desaturase
MTARWIRADTIVFPGSASGLHSDLMTLSPRSYYVHELAEILPATVFRRASSRLWWLPVQLTVIVAATLAIASTSSWLWQLLASLPIGLAFAGLAFLGHETLHGAVVRSPWARSVIGTLGFLPFVLSARLWVRWHGEVHHGNSQHDGADPDAYPTLEAYRSSRLVRFMIDRFSPGGQRWTGVLALLFGFSIQSGKLLVTARTSGLLRNRREHRLAIAATVGAISVWIAVAVAVGAQAFLFAYLVPLMIGNAMVMAHILTNHSLSPLTEINDPLANSLTVTVPTWFRFLTMGFGFHVEHHLFPAMSARHGAQVRRALQERWPERYRSMPLVRALQMLHRTARVYEDATTLCDPRSGRRWRVGDLECQPLSPMS